MSTAPPGIWASRVAGGVLAVCPPAAASCLLTADPADRRRWLSPEEAATLEGFATPARQTEWLAGRLAAKWAALQLEPDAAGPAAHTVVYGQTGQPWLRSPGDSLSMLSISHTTGAAAALLLPAGQAVGVGVDVERVAPRLRRVAPRVLAPAELAQMEVGNDQEALLWLTRVWCAKEAVAKGLGAGISVDFRELVIERRHGLDFTMHLVGEAAQRFGPIRARGAYFDPAPALAGAYALLLTP